MRTLFVYPEFPKTFWSYEKILELVNRKVLLPPMGLVIVAALLPQEWEMKLVDLKALSIVVWRQGIKRNTRTRFWRYLLGMARNNPALLAQFLSVLAHNEHFLEYRSIVQQENPRTAGITASRRTHTSQRTAAGLILSPAHRPCRHAGTAQPSATPVPNKGHGRGD